jgi:hypothetical protein
MEYLSGLYGNRVEGHHKTLSAIRTTLKSFVYGNGEKTHPTYIYLHNERVYPLSMDEKYIPGALKDSLFTRLKLLLMSGVNNLLSHRSYSTAITWYSFFH